LCLALCAYGGKDVYHWDCFSGFGHARERGLHDPLLADLRKDYYFVAARGPFLQSGAVFDSGDRPDPGAFKTAAAPYRDAGSFADPRFFYDLSHEQDPCRGSFEDRLSISIALGENSDADETFSQEKKLYDGTY
jgi:hypothetical protein